MVNCGLPQSQKLRRASTALLLTVSAGAAVLSLCSKHLEDFYKGLKPFLQPHLLEKSANSRQIHHVLEIVSNVLLVRFTNLSNRGENTSTKSR
jgi:hypothetical protein